MPLSCKQPGQVASYLGTNEQPGYKARIKMESNSILELITARMWGCHLTFELTNQVIKKFEYQASKHNFCQIKNLNPSTKCFNRRHITDTTLLQIHTTILIE